MKCGTLDGKEVHSFDSPQKLEQWLAKHHERSSGIFVRLFKKGAEQKSITYADALDEALCHGWIDGVKKRYDDVYWVQWFCPRRPRSVWSRINTGHIERLTKAGRMKPAGQRQVDAAKADGRWEKAYASPANSEVPADFLQALAKNKKAKAFFESLNRANTFAIAFHLHHAKKPETRERRMKKYLEMMARGEKLHP
jgi:uncharacterized protein YdeI (YjbR/CyaY-like superfamily)